MQTARCLLPCAMCAAVLAAAAFAVPPALGAGPPRAAAPADTLTPAMHKAIADLSSREAAARERALAALDTALAQQASTMAALASPEESDRVALVLSRNAALATYLREVVARPAAERAAALEWALSDDHALLIAAVHSARTEDRVVAAQRLGDAAKVRGAEAEAILAQLLKDRSPEVFAAALDAASKRPASEAVVEALWKRAVSDGWMYKRQYVQPPAPKFRGKTLNQVYDPYLHNMNPEPAAVEALIAMKGPLVEKKLLGFLEAFANEKDAAQMQWFMPYYPAVQHVYAILEAQKPRSAVPLLVKVLSGREVNGQEVKNPQVGDYYWSSQTYPLVMFLKLTGQDPEDYQIKKRAEYGNMQWSAGSRKDHSAALARAKTWYEKHKADYEPASTPPATRPATMGTPATRAATAPVGPSGTSQPAR